MAKEFYDVSHKTYFNARIKPVFFQGKEMHPLYVQVTYDRRTIFFKSYYFGLFAQPKYEFLGVTLAQINELETRVIDYILARTGDYFSLDEVSRLYKLLSVDVLDSFDGSFKIWMGAFFRGEGLSGLAVAIEQVGEGVAGIRLWDDCKRSLDAAIFARMEEKALAWGNPYMPLATYVRGKNPEGPFCLPVFEWAEEGKRVEIEFFLDEIYEHWQYDMGQIIREVRELLYPEGFGWR